MFKEIFFFVIIALAACNAEMWPKSLNGDQVRQMDKVWAQMNTYQCNLCLAEQSLLVDRVHPLNKTQSYNSCIDSLSHMCPYSINATQNAICWGAVKQSCRDAQNAVDPKQTCFELGFCDPARPVDSALLGFWGECGGCEFLFEKGIEAAESFVCHGLSSAMSAYCGPGAAICEEILDDACDYVIHDICNTDLLADWICFEFHACGSGPSSSPCHL